MSVSEGMMSEEVLMMVASKGGMEPTTCSLNDDPLGVDDMATSANEDGFCRGGVIEGCFVYL